MVIPSLNSRTRMYLHGETPSCVFKRLDSSPVAKIDRYDLYRRYIEVKVNSIRTTMLWLKNGRYHRDPKFNTNVEQPACMNVYGYCSWVRNGKLHRDDNDSPAVIYDDGSQAWYTNGRFRRHVDVRGRVTNS